MEPRVGAGPGGVTVSWPQAQPRFSVLNVAGVKALSRSLPMTRPMFVWSLDASARLPVPTSARQLVRRQEAMIAVGAANWVVANVSGQLDVILGHIRRHESLLERLSAGERSLVHEASATVRKARQAVPVAFGRREPRRP